MKKQGSYKCFITTLLILFVSMVVHAQSAASKSSYAYLQQRFAHRISNAAVIMMCMIMGCCQII